MTIKTLNGLFKVTFLCLCKFIKSLESALFVHLDSVINLKLLHKTIKNIQDNLFWEQAQEVLIKVDKNVAKFSQT